MCLLDTNNSITETEEITKEDFSFYLENMRMFLGLSRKDFADNLKIPRTSYYTYEQGKSLPKNWQKIKSRINVLINNKSNMIREKESFNNLLNDYLKKEIVSLHLKDRNTVQIGMELLLEESLIIDYLLSLGFSPNYFKLYG